MTMRTSASTQVPLIVRCTYPRSKRNGRKSSLMSTKRYDDEQNPKYSATAATERLAKVLPYTVGASRTDTSDTPWSLRYRASASSNAGSLTLEQSRRSYPSMNDARITAD